MITEGGNEKEGQDMAIYLLVTLNKGQKKDADLEMKEGERERRPCALRV